MTRTVYAPSGISRTRLGRTIRSRVASWAALLVVAIGIGASGCHATTTVPIRVKIAADVDTRKYHTFAVLPFVDRDARLTTEQLAQLTDALRQYIDRVPGMTALSKSATSEALEGEELTASSIENSQNIASWGDALDATAIVTGIVRYYSVPQLHRRYVERYSLQLQRYVTDIETYWARSHYLTLELTVWDAQTGDVILKPAVKSYSREEPQSVLGDVMRAVTGSVRVVNELAREPIREFVRRITPHYEYEERFLGR